MLTDGMWGVNGIDKDQIGVSYEKFEWAMLMDEQNKTEDDINSRSKGVFKIYKRLNTKNKYKMLPILYCQNRIKFR